MSKNLSSETTILLKAIEKVEDKVDEIYTKQINDFHEIKRLKEKQQDLEDRDSCPAIHMHADNCLALAKAKQKALAKDSDTAIPTIKKELIPWSAVLKFAAILTPIAGAITVAILAT